ncbi:MAG TPA: hypothetical protein VK629_09590 [Steroidobacteraceae bacterium]|nr:hypothetical protein [Steroidobacteraceae bacterium]
MSPLAVINALIFGSATAIGFGLTATAVVFAVLRSEQPALERELPVLLASCAWFWLLAGTAGASLYATLKKLWWRWWGQAVMGASLVLIAFVYWPKSAS